MRLNITKKLLTGIIFISSACYASDSIKKDSTKSNECLAVIGIAVDEKNEPIDGVQIRLYKENEESEWVEITCVPYHDHNFQFILDANRYYTIEVSKPGYMKRLVAISTILPSNIATTPIFRFEFDVILSKEKKGVDDFYLDFPIAFISYNAKNEVFENNKNYTSHIKMKIKESVK